MRWQGGGISAGSRQPVHLPIPSGNVPLSLKLFNRLVRIDTYTLKYEDLVALNTAMSEKLWKNALTACEVAEQAGINLSWYALMLSPKSIQQKYAYGYWLQFYLYHDLMEWADRESNESFIKALNIAYFIGDWDSLVKQF